MLSARKFGLFDFLSERECAEAPSGAPPKHFLEKSAQKLKNEFNAIQPNNVLTQEHEFYATKLKELAILGSLTARNFFIEPGPRYILMTNDLDYMLFSQFRDIAWQTKDAKCLYILFQILAPTIPTVGSRILLPNIEEAMRALKTAANQQDEYATTASLVLFHLYRFELDIHHNMQSHNEYVQLISLSDIYINAQEYIQNADIDDLSNEAKTEMITQLTHRFSELGAEEALEDLDSEPFNLGHTLGYSQLREKVSDLRAKSLANYFKLFCDNWLRYGWQSQFNEGSVMYMIDTILCYAMYLQNTKKISKFEEFIANIHQQFADFAEQGHAHAAYYLAKYGHTFLGKDSNKDNPIYWYKLILSLPNVPERLVAQAGARLLSHNQASSSDKPLVTLAELYDKGSYLAAIKLGQEARNACDFKAAERYYLNALRLSPNAAITEVTMELCFLAANSSLQIKRLQIKVLGECAKLGSFSSITSIYQIMSNISANLPKERWDNEVMQTHGKPNEADSLLIDEILDEAIRLIDDELKRQTSEAESLCKIRRSN